PLQGLPNTRIGKDISVVEDEVTAISFADGAGLDQGKVGDETAYHRFFLYHPKEVMIGGIGFDDDGRSLGVAVVNKDIDPVRKKWIGRRLGHLPFRHLTYVSSRVGTLESVRILQAMVPHCIEIG